MNLLIYRLKTTWANLSEKAGFVATVVITLGLTLGVLLCVITLANLLLLKPLPYPDQDQLYQVEHARVDTVGEVSKSSYSWRARLTDKSLLCSLRKKSGFKVSVFKVVIFYIQAVAAFSISVLLSFFVAALLPFIF